MMRTEKSRLMIFATIAAIVGVAGNLIAATVLLQTNSNLWIMFSALAVGASLLAAYTTLTASQKQSLESNESGVRVFLSYAREDEERVEALYKRLQAEGFEPWMDIKRLTPGENWIQGMERAIDDSDFVVALISKNSMDKRGFIQREIKLSLDLLGQEANPNVRVISARLDNTVVPDPLKTSHQIDLFEENGFSRLINTLRSRTEENEKQSLS